MFRRVLAAAGVLGVLVASLPAAEEDFEYLIGRSVQDVTGPPVGVLMLGFVRADQISEGLHTRQYARAFVVSDKDKSNRVAFVVVDTAMVTYSLKREALDRLRATLGDAYHEGNFILSATHTHGAPGGFHHHLALSPIGGPFHQAYFDVLAEGISEAVRAAHAGLRPGDVYLARGRVEGAGVNRSAVAYQNNPPEERMRYADDVDKTMTQLTFVDASGEIGVLNWFAVHPTSMTFFNRLITGDNKGVASAILEKERGTTYADAEDFVAGFAQTNCGDVTPNLNLNNTGPGRDDFESTRIIAERQAVVARALAAQRGEKLRGPIERRFRYVDFSCVEVADEFTGRGTQRTCPSAFGYAFAAGSTEDGGGHPLFREGMKEPNPLIEGVLAAASPGPKPTPELRECHKPKVILFSPGAARPPMQEQVMPLGLVRIGQFVLVVGPCEYTTMTGRRIREAVARDLDAAPDSVVLAGYSNEFGGYVTTFEEYQAQQYEGGHTIFGPWEEAAFRQEFVKLARAMREGEPAESEAHPRDMRGEVPDTPIAGLDDLPPPDARFGAVVEDAPERVPRGEAVHVAFWTGNPNNGYARGDRYLAVQRLADGKWETIASDEDVATRIRFVQTGGAPSPDKPANPVLEAYQLGPRGKKLRPEPFHAVVSWEVASDEAPGRYRIVHFGRRLADGRIERFDGVSREFEVE